MSKTKAGVLATAITGLFVFVLAQFTDMTIDQAVASHITTIITTLIALFMPPPSGGAVALSVSPRTVEESADEVEQPAIFTEEITE